MQHRHKDLDEVLFKFFTLDFDLPEHEGTKHNFIVIRGNHRKGAFAMLTKIHTEAHNSLEPIYFDKVSDEIDSSKDEIEALRPLANNIRIVFSHFNVYHNAGNAHRLGCMNNH